jgi:hypothetical protein
MVINKSELIASFQKEAHILNHLVHKIDQSRLDYRPTEGQRNTGDLVRYLSMMGPTLVKVALAGSFDGGGWSAAAKHAEQLSYEQAVSVISGHGALYAQLLGDVPDEQLQREVTLLGSKASRGFFLVNLALCHCAAYRTQLFLYLKACGRAELGTMNLWMGADPAPKT